MAFQFLAILIARKIIRSGLLSFRSNLGHPVRFNELKSQRSVTATTLSRRLEEFVEVDLVSEKFCQRPLREVSTRLGEEKTLGGVLKTLFAWIEENK